MADQGDEMAPLRNVFDLCGLPEDLSLGSNLSPVVSKADIVVPPTLVLTTFPGVDKPERDVVMVVIPPDDTFLASKAL